MLRTASDLEAALLPNAETPTADGPMTPGELEVEDLYGSAVEKTKACTPRTIIGAIMSIATVGLCFATLAIILGGIIGSAYVIAFFVIPCIFCGFTCTFMIIESCTHPIHKAFLNEMTAQRVDSHVDSMRGARPRLTMSVACWHTETRLVTRTRTNASGHMETYTETQTVRVDTASYTHLFEYDTCNDLSAQFRTSVPSELRLMLQFKLQRHFEDNATELAWQEESAALQKAYVHRDTHMDYHENIQVPDWLSHVLQTPASGSSFVYALPVYYFSVICCFNWIYRIFVAQSTDTAKYAVVKSVRRINYVPVPHF